MAWRGDGRLAAPGPLAVCVGLSAAGHLLALLRDTVVLLKLHGGEVLWVSTGPMYSRPV